MSTTKRIQGYFHIDFTLVEIIKKKDITYREIIKSALQFIWTLDKEYSSQLCCNKNTLTPNEILEEVIAFYAPYTLTQLSNKYKSVGTFLTPEQKKSYTNISKKKVNDYFLNSLISIAINNSQYSNYQFQKEIKNDIIINKFTLDFFLSFQKKSDICKTTIICLMEALLFKLHDTIKKQIVEHIHFKNLYTNVLQEYFKIEDTEEYLKNPYLLKFFYEEFGKIYFIMVSKYNISITKKMKFLKTIYHKNNTILLEKYNNNLNCFKISEPIIEKNISTIEQYNCFSEYFKAMFPNPKEIQLLSIIWKEFSWLDIIDS